MTNKRFIIFVVLLGIFIFLSLILKPTPYNSIDKKFYQGHDSNIDSILSFPSFFIDTLLQISSNRTVNVENSGIQIFNFVELQCRSCLTRFKNWETTEREIIGDRNVRVFHIFSNNNSKYIKSILDELGIKIEDNLYLDPKMELAIHNNINTNSIILVNNSKIISTNLIEFKGIINASY
mgnify:CR=1 FL=1